MEKISFQGLQPDIFFAQPWFEDFVEAYADVLNELIRDPMDQLENIRNVTDTTDPWVATQALKQIGFDLPMDFVDHNFDKLKSALQQLVHYSERSGTVDYPRQMQFIYGRGIDVTELYTNDYKSFYDQSYGPLLIDGGDWYKTTHVELGMQMLSSDGRLVIPRGTALKDRFLDAFYELAPWNVVVERFHFNIDFDMTVYLSGVVFKHPKRYIELGLGSSTVGNLLLSGPDRIDEFKSAPFVVTGLRESIGEDGTLERATIVVDATFSSSRPGLITWVNNVANVGGVTRNTQVVIYATYKDQTLSKFITVMNNLENVESIYIEGPDNVRSDETHEYKVFGRTRSGIEQLDIDITSSSYEVQVQNNVADFSRTQSSKTVYLSATLDKGNQKLNTVLPVFVFFVTDAVHVERLELSLPSETFERSMVQVLATAHYSDGHYRTVLADYSTDSDAIRVLPHGDAYIYDVESDLVAHVTGTYQDNGISVTDTKPIKIKSRTNDIVFIEIVGPHTVYKETRTRYALEATFADGSKNFIECDWTTTHFTISESGILTTGYVSERSLSLTIRAFVDGRSTLKSINVIPEPIVLNNIYISGPDSLNEGSSAVFTATAQYSDQRQVVIEPTWSVVGSPSWATINANGLFSFSVPKEGIVEVRAVYVNNGKRFTQTRPIVLIPKTKIIAGLVISGPNKVEEGRRISLTATAIYSDNTTETVSPMWSVFPSDPMNEDEPMADIVSPGVLQGRTVEKETGVIAVARYFSGIAEFPVTVLPYVMRSPDIPVESRIIGPTTFMADTRATYAHMIRFEHCDELAVSSTWEIDVPSDEARIDNNGVLWSETGRELVVTVTSTYACGDQTVIDSIVVNIVGTVEPNLQALKIYGDTLITDKAPRSYLAELYYRDQEIREGIGTKVKPEWSIIGGGSKVAVNSAGTVYVLDNSSSFSFTLKAVYSEVFETVEDTLEIQVIAQTILQPVFGVGPIGIRSDSQIQEFLSEEAPNLSTGFTFSLVSNLGEYMYFTHPVSLGIARFFDLDSGFEGGWDGASWPDDGDIGTVYGPIVVQRLDSSGNTSDWYLYRTDFDGLGEINYRIEF